MPPQPDDAPQPAHTAAEVVWAYLDAEYEGRTIQVRYPADLPLLPLAEVELHPRNAREGDVGSIVESIVVNGFLTSILVQNQTSWTVSGNHRLKAARELRMTHLPGVRAPLTDIQATRYLVADNRTSDLATYNTEGLAELLVELSDSDEGLDGTGYDGDALDELLDSLNTEGASGASDEKSEDGGPGDQNPDAKGNLQGRFLIPPFSVLDTRQGYWRTRKAAWLKLGLKSELGREGVETFAVSAQSPHIYNLRNAMRAERGGVDPTWDEIVAEAHRRNIPLHAGISIFDPVLTELGYLWFCPPAGTVLDPFAGGSVRGVVAAALGLSYVGVELRGEQVEANRQQWSELAPRLSGLLGGDSAAALPAPAWVQGDSCDIPTLIPDVRADLVYSCPPYFDLEVYSDDPRDISNMDYAAFHAAYRQIIQNAVNQLKDNRFAVFVVNDVRDKRGFYVNLLADTIRAFEDAGAHSYNEMVLINNVGSAAIRAGRQFAASRKAARTHQNMLVFFKGDPKTIGDTYPELTIPDLESFADPDEALDADPEGLATPGSPA